MPKITKRVVDNAKAGSVQVLVWDSDVKGFGLRITPAGAKSYILNYRTQSGRLRRYTIGKNGSPWTCEAARSKAIELQRGLVAGFDPLEIKAGARSAKTVVDLIELYLSDGPIDRPNKKASSWTTDASNLRRHVAPLIGSRLIQSLKRADVTRLQADVAAGKTRADIKTGYLGRAIVKGGRGIGARVTAVFGAMCEFAVRHGLLASNPAKGVQIAKGEKKERFLLEREVIALADALGVMQAELALSPTMANAIRLLLLTGCRRNEIRSLQWEWIDFDRRYLRLPDSKTGAKLVPLAASALQLLASIDRVSPFVFPSSRTDGHIIGLQKAWSKVRARASALARQRAVEAGELVDRAPDLMGVRLHDLRHSFASFAVADGASLLLVSRVLGHRQTRTTELYSHFADDPLRAVADRTGARIARAMQIGESRLEGRCSGGEAGRQE